MTTRLATSLALLRPRSCHSGISRPSLVCFLGLGLWLNLGEIVCDAAEPTVGVTLKTVSSSASMLHPTAGVGHWIWADQTFDQQTCRFWRAFEIPRTAIIRQARLRMTADNSFQLWIDGREIGRGGEWRTLSEYDLTLIIGPGPHVIAVEAFNDYAAAGMLLGLHIDYADGKALEIASDEHWRLAPLEERSWEKRKHAGEKWPAAKVIADFGQAPWQQSSGSIRVRTPPGPTPGLHFWQKAWFQITWLSVCGIVIAICLRLMGKLALQSKAQEMLQRERARIARDIHDELGAGLTELVLLGEVNQSELPADSRLRDRFNHLSEKSRNLLRAMNEVVWVVNSQRDTLRDFASYVSKYAETYLQASPIRCRLDVGDELSPVPLDLAIRRNMFLAVKEALHNSVKHSNASELFLRIHRRGHELVVVVEDNGKGFDPVAADPQRNGLSNMSQRAEGVGGRCKVGSRPGGGSRIELIAPLEHPPKRRSILKMWRWSRRSRPPEARLANSGSASFTAQTVKSAPQT